MLHLGIDQHKSQLTVNLRNEHGDVIDKRQVSTKHSGIEAYFNNLAKQAARHRGFMAIVEVCGFNPWLLEELKRHNCREIGVVQPDGSFARRVVYPQCCFRFTSQHITDYKNRQAKFLIVCEGRKRFLPCRTGQSSHVNNGDGND